MIVLKFAGFLCNYFYFLVSNHFFNIYVFLLFKLFLCRDSLSLTLPLWFLRVQHPLPIKLRSQLKLSRLSQVCWPQTKPPKVSLSLYGVFSICGNWKFLYFVVSQRTEIHHDPAYSSLSRSQQAQQSALNLDIWRCMGMC